MSVWQWGAGSEEALRCMVCIKTARDACHWKPYQPARAAGAATPELIALTASLMGLLQSSLLTVSRSSGSFLAHQHWVSPHAPIPTHPFAPAAARRRRARAPTPTSSTSATLWACTPTPPPATPSAAACRRCRRGWTRRRGSTWWWTRCGTVRALRCVRAQRGAAAWEHSTLEAAPGCWVGSERLVMGACWDTVSLPRAAAQGWWVGRMGRARCGGRVPLSAKAPHLPAACTCCPPEKSFRQRLPWRPAAPH